MSTQGWNRYAYVHNNPIVYKDPTGHITIVLETNRDDVYGNKAIQLFEGGSIIKFYDKWVTRGVNKEGQEVAIKSDSYDYKVEDSSKRILKKTPRLLGKKDHSMEGEDISGGFIETLGPNNNHKDSSGKPLNLAAGIRGHQMRETPLKNDPKYGNKDYVWSEGCQGPVGKKDAQRFLEGKKIGDEGKYVLIRPTEYIDKAKSKITGAVHDIKTNVKELIEKFTGE